MHNKKPAITANPTSQAYAELQEAFEHFNLVLFDKALPDCLITLQREKRTYGYFSRLRFVDHTNGTMVDEIAMNPSYFAVRPIRETLSTLVHEMVHQWQFHHGSPGRRGYHNQEWSEKMESVGLVPSHTGEPGGRKTGDQMTHYIKPARPFDLSCKKLLTVQFTLSWFDRFPPVQPTTVLDDNGDDGLSSLIELPPAEPVNRSNRLKYRCPSCNAQVWGKPGLRILCGIEQCNAAPLDPVEG